MNIEELGKLAKSYSMRIQVLPTSAILVYSQISEWLVEVDDRNNIRLCHFNNPRKSCRTHQQVVFRTENKVADYNFVFKYIRGHDDSIVTGSKLLKSVK